MPIRPLALCQNCGRVHIVPRMFTEANMAVNCSIGCPCGSAVVLPSFFRDGNQTLIASQKGTAPILFAEIKNLARQVAKAASPSAAEKAIEEIAKSQLLDKDVRETARLGLEFLRNGKLTPPQLVLLLVLIYTLIRGCQPDERAKTINIIEKSPQFNITINEAVRSDDDETRKAIEELTDELKRSR